MKREIKFRIWDAENGKMTRPASIAEYMEADAITIPDGEEDYIMQYTGLRDKNGKEIYEGDIVHCTDKYDKEFIYHVRFNRQQSGFYYVTKDCEDGDWFSQINMFDNGEEVIGNIYQNPELLK